MQNTGHIPTYTRGNALPSLLRERILILDGAMGTMIQQYKLTESDYRGDRFADFSVPGKELFVKDGLHFNADGYKLLAEKVRPLLAR